MCLVCVYLHSYVLDQILSGAPLDAVIEQVQAFLQGLAEELRGNAIPLPEYVITKVGGATSMSGYMHACYKVIF